MRSSPATRSSSPCSAAATRALSTWSSPKGLRKRADPTPITEAPLPLSGDPQHQSGPATCWPVLGSGRGLQAVAHRVLAHHARANELAQVVGPAGRKADAGQPMAAERLAR